ncbi:MAG: hypothetical protein QNJ13_15310 [Paracoccaceae bacterium]|nr:hypothetical protein [Paracoccaceae bacterium]
MTRGCEQSKWVAALVFGALLTVSPAVSAESYSDTCQYFTAQAFKDRRAHRGTTLPMNLAQDCVDAQIYARSDDAGVRARAEAYLAQLETYREVMVAMLVARARARTPGEPSLRRHVRPAVRPVSEAGAYLIARQMGLVDTHESWTAWRQSLAFADPRVRLE